MCIHIHTHIYGTQDGTGRRRLIGSPELQIIFHKRATKYRSLLRKMTYKDKGSYESSPPCTQDLLAKYKICRYFCMYMYVYTYICVYIHIHAQIHGTLDGTQELFI